MNTAWEYLQDKGIGPLAPDATAAQILQSGVTGRTAWEELLDKSPEPDPSTAWVHLTSTTLEVELDRRGGGLNFVRVIPVDPERRRREDQLLTLVGLFVSTLDD